MWAFACLLYYVYNDNQVRSSDLASASNVPPALRTQYRKAIDATPARRPSPVKFLASSFFDTPFIKRMDFLENLAIKSPEEKAEFYKDLCANLASLPEAFGVHKVLPALKAVVEFGTVGGAKNAPVKLDPSASHMLPAMIQIGSSLSTDEFKDQVLPIIVKLFTCNDRAVRVQLLQMMEKFAVHFDAKLVNSTVVFDNICSGFTDAAPVLRELTVKSMLHIADKLSDSNLNTRVMKYFAKLQVRRWEPVRVVGCLVQLGVYVRADICAGWLVAVGDSADRSGACDPHEHYDLSGKDRGEAERRDAAEGALPSVRKSHEGPVPARAPGGAAVTHGVRGTTAVGAALHWQKMWLVRSAHMCSLTLALLCRSIFRSKAWRATLCPRSRRSCSTSRSRFGSKRRSRWTCS